MTPEQLAGLNAFYEQYPNGIDLGGEYIDLGQIGSGYTGTGSSGGYTHTPVVPVASVQGLGPQTVGPANVSAATNYGLTGAVPTQVAAVNPFERPESQEGIGSLAGGG